MKTSLIAIFIITVATLSAAAQTDLNTRKALYFTGAKTDAIDLAKDVYVAGGSTLNLSAELRTSCDNNICEFNVGVIAMRSGSGAMSTEIKIEVEKGATFTKQVSFGASESTKRVVLPMKLKLGKNLLTITIDPSNSTAESDEGNNSFTGTVMLNWKRNPDNKE